MKHLYILLFVCFNTTLAQNNYINYKAVVKDSIGNIIANHLVDVEFTIAYEYEIGVETGVMDTMIVYRESHVTNTNNSGLIILNIGEGTPSHGNYNEIFWGSTKDRMLNTKVDIGDGIVDLGYTKFMTVPYALHSKSTSFRTLNNVTSNSFGDISVDDFVFGDSKLDLDAGNTRKFFFDKSKGAFRVGRIVGDNWNEENIGSSSFAAGSSPLASGYNSVAFGYETKASGSYSAAFGDETEASGLNSTAFGNQTKASGQYAFAAGDNTFATGESSIALNSYTLADGDYSAALGLQTDAEAYASMVIGRYNVGGGVGYYWADDDPVFEIGIGSSFSNRGNAMTVLKNGNVGIGTTTPGESLHVSGKIRFASLETLEDGGTNEIAVRADLRPTEDNYFDLGTSNYRWDDVYATNGTIQTSDSRDKTNMTKLGHGLKEIMQLKPISFNWKESPNDTKKLGLVAQNLLQVLPEVVKTHEWKALDEADHTKKELVEMDRMGVYYSDLIPVLIKAIQEQQEMINKLIEHNKSESLKQKRLVTN